MTDEKKIHLGHRQRAKDAMLNYGLDGLNDHQVLEILLFYGISNGDTNPIAHRLVDRFGSLRGVLEADYDELRTVKGIGDNAASLIKFAQLFSGRYLRASSFEADSLTFADTGALIRYFEGVFLGVQNEQIRAMLLDDNLHFVKEQLITEGTIGKVEFATRKFTDFVIKNNCNRVVIAHNHPNGFAMPSNADIEATKELMKIFEKLEITLLDHIIVGRTGSYSFRSSKLSSGLWDNIIKR